jgi:hypothetical protein
MNVKMGLLKIVNKCNFSRSNLWIFFFLNVNNERDFKFVINFAMIEDFS